MIGIHLRGCGLALMIVAAPSVHAADPESLLARMQRAAQTLNYDGIFVYQNGDRLESLRIVHRVGPRGVEERLVSLNGAPREIVRTDREVRCYLPDGHAALIEHRRAGKQGFPSLLPGSPSLLGRAYAVQTGREGRVAGRNVRLVTISPRDGYRYGYQLWADEASGLLLKAGLVDEQGRVVEQYMFTEVSIGRPIANAALAPQYLTREAARQPVSEPTLADTPGQWQPGRLPDGFALTARVVRNLPGSEGTVEHLVYSDGLAVVSVFIEPVTDASGPAAVDGLSRMGAVHAFGTVIDDRRVTVVGETPAATVAMIGESISRRRP
jgi:sigma-E factor negative regulatory protein RseB